MAKQTVARPAAATASARRPPRVSSVPAFGGWEVDGKAAAADYSQDFTKIRAARMQRRTKALSWSSFVETQSQTPGGGGGGGKGGQEEEEKRHQWSSAATSDVDDDDDDRDRERRHRHGHRRLRSVHINDSDDDDDRRQPIKPGRPSPKGRSKFKGYLFGCAGGQW